MADETNETMAEQAEHDPGISDIRRPMVEGAVAAEAGSVAVPAEAPHGDGGHEGSLSDTTVVFGRTITVEGGIYTVIFGFLALATVLELIIGSLPHTALVVPLLLALAVIKAALVVMFYMHLRTDIRLFAYILIVPTALALAAMLYLLSVPMTGY